MKDQDCQSIISQYWTKYNPRHPHFGHKYKQCNARINHTNSTNYFLIFMGQKYLLNTMKNDFGSLLFTIYHKITSKWGRFGRGEEGLKRVGVEGRGFYISGGPNPLKYFFALGCLQSQRSYCII